MTGVVNAMLIRLTKKGLQSVVYRTQGLWHHYLLFVRRAGKQFSSDLVSGNNRTWAHGTPHASRVSAAGGNRNPFNARPYWEQLGSKQGIL